jgi:hypothetical protein
VLQYSFCDTVDVPLVYKRRCKAFDYALMIWQHNFNIFQPFDQVVLIFLLALYTMSKKTIYTIVASPPGSKRTVMLTHTTMVSSIRISGDQSWEKISYRNIALHHTKHGCFGRLAVRATCCTRNFSKKIALFEKSTFLPVLGRFCMRALWRRFEWKMPIFCPQTQFLAGSLHAAAIFSKNARDWPLIMRFLDSWLHGASAGYRVGVV